ncbi:Cas10/Cmr2 second palm domain-containing protein [Ferrovum myxofaciens]|uniref:Cas10/Cmr2 second palm domain-containing protein n=1 Tax=Ferrovum myxofaciens TaxID=416213 RepID=UPI003EBA3494
MFEVKSIQKYIFLGDRLRDTIGASELIDLLTNEKIPEENLLDNVLSVVAAKDSIEFSRRAGGAFYAFSRDAIVLARFSALWSLAVQHWAPGLSFDMGKGSGKTMLEAFDTARRNMQSSSSHPRAFLPLGSPITLRTPRTGMAATKNHSHEGAIDSATVRKRIFSDLSTAGFIDRFSPPGINWRDWPTSFEPNEPDLQNSQRDSKPFNQIFPFVGENRSVAMIHADGNGMGQILRQLKGLVESTPDRFQELYKDFSNAVECSTIQAAQEAVKIALIPYRKPGEPLAARPILLGGDDVIVIVRSDLALHYIQAFASAFERESATRLRALNCDLPPKLTIGFGVVYLLANQPFSLAVQVAEKLMGHAKNDAKKIVPNGQIPPSTVMFHRVTGTLSCDVLEPIRRSDHTTLELTMGTYVLSTEFTSPLPKLGDLFALQALLQHPAMAHGPIRQLLNLLESSPTQARQSWARWRFLMKEKPSEILNKFDEIMKQLLPQYNSQKALPYAPLEAQSPHHRTPLGDVLTLRAVNNLLPENISEEARV